MHLNFKLILGTVLIGFLIFIQQVNAQVDSVFAPLIENSLFTDQIEKIENNSSKTPDVFHPVQVEVMRDYKYPGSNITIVEELPPHYLYRIYLTYYLSQGNKIYSLLTVPTTLEPQGGWPVIIFNHGYIPPEEYKTTVNYISWQHEFASQGFVTFKPDYRGHGNSDGVEEGAFFSPGYTVDVLNSVASIKKLNYINNSKIGMFGHSMGGHLLLKSMVISNEIAAGVIWAGVTSSYTDIFSNWNKDWNIYYEDFADYDHKQDIEHDGVVNRLGQFAPNAYYWDSISSTSYLKYLSGPLQIHHGTSDEEVPYSFSENLTKYLDIAGKDYEFYKYEGADHNLSGSSFSLAMSRSVEFFNLHLK